MHYQRNQRVVLDITTDPHTLLHPGAQGTVLRHDEALDTVYIRWDDGSALAMCLDAGDRIHPADEASPNAAADGRDTSAEPDPTQPRYPQVQVQLTGTDGNAHILIGKVAVALRRQVGDHAADAFSAAAYACGSYDELLYLLQSTVEVS